MMNANINKILRTEVPKLKFYVIKNQSRLLTIKNEI